MPRGSDLEQIWDRITAHLLAALAVLPPSTGDAAREKHVREFHEWIAHNELGLALDELEVLADLSHPAPEFWDHLSHAAAEMKLEAHVQRFRAKGAG